MKIFLLNNNVFFFLKNKVIIYYGKEKKKRILVSYVDRDFNINGYILICVDIF